KGPCNGAEPVREYINQQAARIAELESRNESLAEALLRCCTYLEGPCDVPGCDACELLKYCETTLENSSLNLNITRFEKVISAGQIQQDDHLILHTKEGIITAKANEIIRPGVTDDSDGEEVIYNRKKNHYFITSMVISGQSWVKEVYIVKPQEPSK
ncbi:hypothetical protein, partial [uncultured Amphritea sp.]|uniref:hypothetical protein n=1 Tax=uncultured Amphritea sp. TaxID=981605 RepID=UPI00261B41BB